MLIWAIYVHAFVVSLNYRMKDLNFIYILFNQGYAYYLVDKMELTNSRILDVAKFGRLV